MAKRKPKPTARRDTVTVQVHSPITPGTIDRPERVVDSIFLMWRAGQLTDAQYAAAQRRQWAYETLQAGGCGAVDWLSAPSHRPGSRIPAEASFEAGRIMRETSYTLACLSEAPGAPLVVHLVVDLGYGLKEAEECLWASYCQGEPIGKILRLALDAIG